MNGLKKHPYLCMLFIYLIICVIGMGYFFVTNELSGSEGIWKIFMQSIVLVPILVGFLGVPLIGTVYEGIILISTIRKVQKKEEIKCNSKHVMFDFILICLAILYEIILLGIINEVQFGADWQEQLHNGELHTPIYSGAWLTVLVIFLLSILGMLFLELTNATQIPPLLNVLAISSTYLGGIYSVIWTYHIWTENDGFSVYLLLLPLNCFFIVARIVIQKMTEYIPNQDNNSKLDKVPALGACNKLLKDVSVWPVMAIILMIPLIGIMIGILILFGQEPDAMIKAFLETSDYNLSQKIGPQNIYEDQHYLCTVAAGGHGKIVKPLRKGYRHGHEVIVNRQLCIANAFEQILEEKTPVFHRGVRKFYDTYGFPIAKLIKKRWIADIIYFIMKPLEWIFLIVLYICDINPENRISCQYIKK